MGASADSLAMATSGIAGQAGDFSWWQTVGGSLVVFVLLLLCLRLLARWHRPGGRRRASVLEVWSLGPRREIQIVRLQDDVHYVYRHENAMVLLKRQDHAAYQADQPLPAENGRGTLRARLLGRGVLSHLLPSSRVQRGFPASVSEESGA